MLPARGVGVKRPEGQGTLALPGAPAFRVVPGLFIDGIDKELCQSWPLFNGNGFFVAKANNLAIIA